MSPDDFRVRQDSFRLTDADPGYGAGMDEQDAQRRLVADIEEMADLQDRFYAQDRYALLVILQAPDAAGKDGAIKHVMSGLNPSGTNVFSFKTPTPEELNHDFLWRTSRRLPERGHIGIFNRSYYEEALIVRVHPEYLAHQRLPPELVTGDIWRERFEDINAFERYLTRNGTRILKIFLNVSKEEQKRRFLHRITTPAKNWKFSEADLNERALWPAYQRAFEELLIQTSTPWAPWYVVPADHKSFARLVVANLILHELRRVNPSYPKVSDEQAKALERAQEILEHE